MIVFRCFVLNTESCLAAVCMNNDNEPGKNNGHTHTQKETKNQQNHMIVSIILIVFVRAITKTNGCVKMDGMQSSPLLNVLFSHCLYQCIHFMYRKN